jgi:Ran GTPase-activating protein (RanGAP) involved in mRNA processing and transport
LQQPIRNGFDSIIPFFIAPRHIMTFGQNCLSIDGMLIDSVTIASVVRDAKEKSHITELTLRNVNIDQTVATAITDLLQSTRGKRIWAKLETIHCTGLMDAIIRAATIPCVQQFCFTGSVPIAHNPRYTLDTPSLQALGTALRGTITATMTTNNNHQSLTTLCLKGTRLERPGLQALCDGLAHSTCLRILRMSHLHISALDVDLLATALRQNKHLEVLLLAHCKLNDDPTHDHFSSLLEALVSHPALQCLNVYGMMVNQRATNALAQLLTFQNTQLWHLGLKNNVGVEEKLDISCIIAALARNRTCSSLHISGNQVDDADMTHFSRILSQDNSTLKGLMLANNTIRDEGLQVFASRLVEFKGLRYLDLQRNQFTEPAKQTIISMLPNNRELERLDLDGTYDETKCFYLALNRGGRRLLLSSTAPLSVWPMVLARAAKMTFGRNLPHVNLDVLYCLVRGPALFEQRQRRQESPPIQEDSTPQQKQKQSQEPEETSSSLSSSPPKEVTPRPIRNGKRKRPEDDISETRPVSRRGRVL